jgi:predicted  nucleic acid-binding Zn-ribbon protein
MIFFCKRNVLALLALVVAAAAQAETPLNEARTTLEKWVETRQMTSKARSDWQADKETLEQTVQMFGRELKAVEEQMSKVSTNNVQVDKERAEAEALKKSAAESLARARQFSAGIEAKIIKLVPQLPAPLQDILKPLLNRLPTDPNTKISAAERLQVVVGVMNELDKFNNAVAIFNEKRKNAQGEEVAVETVYVGLGAAYFVNESGSFAGVGAPGASGWEWTAKPELADPVREVIHVYRNDRPAQFVALPATIR